VSATGRKISFRLVAGRPIVSLAFVVLLAGCTAALEDRVARQDAAMSDLRAGVDSFRSDLRDLRDEVAALREALATESRQAAADRATGESGTREAQQALGTRLTAAERRLDELGDGISGLEGSVASLAEQIARLEAGSGSAASLRRTRPSASRGSAATISPEELFDRAMESFRAGELGQAVLDFEEFADKYPAHPLAPSVQFWIGEAYFRSRDFEQAAAKYQKAVDLAPTGDRTSDALLRLGLALRSLHREDRAHEVWARLLHDFPDSEAASRARVVLRQPNRTMGSAEPR
jgi:tol-pal system protein YbgF